MTLEDKPTAAAGQSTEGDERLPSEVVNLLGKRVGNFLVSGFLGQGGMGTVFTAEHPALGRRVAVKFLSPALSMLPEMAIRFLEEARTAASLRHPNIVDIFDFGELEGRPYYVMELLEGMDLRAVMSQRGRLPIDEVAEYVTQIAAALGVAHDRGVVHRDLKPPNVFVLAGSPLRIKLMDFGIARVLDNSRATQTLSGQILGTPSHMAPEQVLGNLREISPQTDLYALGVILYEMLTGVPLFKHESAAMVMFMHLREPFVPIRNVAPEVPLGVARIVEQCLRKAAADRPSSAADVTREFLAACKLASAPHPILTAPPTARAPAGAAPSPDVVLADSSQDKLPLAKPVLAAEPLPVPAPAPQEQGGPGERARAKAPSPPTMVSPAAPVAAASPPGSPDAELSGGEQAALVRLLTRMQNKGDFPAFVKNVTHVTLKADLAGAASARQLGDAILEDYALTAKLLRVVNSSYYERFGKKITKISRAVVVMGFEQVRAIALSVAIHKNSDKKPHARELAELSFNALVSGEIARNVASAVGLRDGEEAMVCAMFRNLGQHLVVHYLPEDYDKICALVGEQKVDFDAAVEKVLGISFRKLGTGIVKKWRLSPRISASMALVNRDTRPAHEEDRLRIVSAFSNELAETVSATSEGDVDLAVDALLRRYRKTVPIPAAEVPKIFAAVRQSFKRKYSTLLGLDPERSRFFQGARRLGPAAPEKEPSPVHPGTSHGGGTPPNEGGIPAGTPPRDRSPLSPSGPQPDAPRDFQSEELDRSLEKIEATRRGPHDPAELMEMVLQAFASGFGFRRALVLVANRERSCLQVQAAWGEDAKMLKDELTIPLSSSLSLDVFSVAFYMAKDIVILDAFDEKNTARVARNYYEMLGSAVFVLYPCAAKGAAKLLFADSDSAEAVPKSDKSAYLQKFRELLAGETAKPSALAHKEIRPFVPKRILK